MADKTEVWLGTLSLMVLRTLATMGPQHGYGLARRIEQISGDQLVPQLRHALSRIAQARTGRSHHFRMGCFRKQSQGQVLPLE